MDFLKDSLRSKTGVYGFNSIFHVQVRFQFYLHMEYTVKPYNVKLKSLENTCHIQIFQLVSVRRASDPKVDAWSPIFLCRRHEGLEHSAAHCHRSVYSVIIPSTPEIPSVHKVVSIMTMIFAG